MLKSEELSRIQISLRNDGDLFTGLLDDKAGRVETNHGPTVPTDEPGASSVLQPNTFVFDVDGDIFVRPGMLPQGRRPNASPFQERGESPRESHPKRYQRGRPVHQKQQDSDE
jgi:hypothetical protein